MKSAGLVGLRQVSVCHKVVATTSLTAFAHPHYLVGLRLKKLCHYKRRVVTKNRNPPF